MFGPGQSRIKHWHRALKLFEENHMSIASEFVKQKAPNLYKNYYIEIIIKSLTVPKISEPAMDTTSIYTYIYIYIQNHKT